MQLHSLQAQERDVEAQILSTNMQKLYIGKACEYDSSFHNIWQKLFI